MTLTISQGKNRPQTALDSPPAQRHLGSDRLRSHGDRRASSWRWEISNRAPGNARDGDAGPVIVDRPSVAVAVAVAVAVYAAPGTAAVDFIQVVRRGG
jgi:hypothetical protein